MIGYYILEINVSLRVSGDKNDKRLSETDFSFFMIDLRRKFKGMQNRGLTFLSPQCRIIKNFNDLLEIIKTSPKIYLCGVDLKKKSLLFVPEREEGFPFKKVILDFTEISYYLQAIENKK